MSLSTSIKGYYTLFVPKNIYIADIIQVIFSVSGSNTLEIRNKTGFSQMINSHLAKACSLTLQAD